MTYAKLNRWKTTVIVGSLALLVSSLWASWAAACPNGISGKADPSAVVCAQQGNKRWCVRADAKGNYNLTGAATSPSTEKGCLPTKGTFKVYSIACPNLGLNTTSPKSNINVACGFNNSWPPQ